MAKDISIVVSAKDNFSTAIRNMRTAQTAFRKDLDELNKGLNVLNNNKIKLKIDLGDAQTALKQAKKSYEELGTESTRTAYEMAQADYDQVKRNLNLVGTSARQTEKDIQNLTNTTSKAENRAGGGMLKSIMGAGLTQQLGQSLSGAAGAAMTSAFGTDVGGIFSNLLSGVVTGAAIGSLGGPAGTAIGAGVGLVSGGIAAVTQVATSKDEAYKGSVQNLYGSLTDEQATTLAAGSATAASRETTRMAFATMLGGMEEAEAFLAQVEEMANNTPFTYDELTGLARVAKPSYGVDEILPLFTQLGDTRAAMGLGTADMEMWIKGLSKMKTTGKITQEYLNFFSERGVDVYEYLAQAFEIPKDKVMDAVTKGLIPGAEAAKAIADYMGEAYKGSMEMQAKGMEGLSSTLQDAETAMNVAMGEGFNEVRKPGIQKQIEWRSGENGIAMKEVNRLIGAYEADLVNKQEELTRAAVEAATGTPEYIKAELEGKGVEMGEMLELAKAQAQTAYTETEEYTQYKNAQLALIKGIQNSVAINSAYWETGYNQGQMLSQGRLAALGGETLTTGKLQMQGLTPANPTDLKPSNEYNNSGNVTVNMGGVTMHEAADAPEVAREIARQIAMKQVVYGGAR